MSTKRSEAKAGVSHRPTMHLRLESLPLADDSSMAGHAFGQEQANQEQTDNEWLIFYSRDVANKSGSCGSSQALMDRALEEAVEPRNVGFGYGGGVAMRALKRFFCHFSE